MGMLAEEAGVFTILSQVGDLITMLRHRTATLNSPLNNRLSRMLPSTRASTLLLNTRSRAQVAIPNISSTGPTRDSLSTRTILASQLCLLRTITRTMRSTFTSSNLLRTVLNSRSNQPMVPLLLSSRMASRTLLRNSQVVRRSSGVPPRPRTLLQPNLISSNSTPVEAEEDITTSPRRSPWAHP